MQLQIDGAVEKPTTFNFADLESLAAQAGVTDIGKLDAKRKGEAISLLALLGAVEVKPSAAYLTLHASRDDFHASIPLGEVRNRALLIFRLSGQPLAVSAGGPIRFYIPDFAACHSAEIDECANVKFVDRIELSATRGHDNRPQDERQHAAIHARPS